MSGIVAAHPDGTTVRVRAVPGASRDRVVGEHGGALKVAVAAPPEKGKANQRLATVLAEALAVPARSIELLSGATSRDKVFLIRGIAPDDAGARIAAALDGRG